MSRLNAHCSPIQAVQLSKLLILQFISPCNVFKSVRSMLLCYTYIHDNICTTVLGQQICELKENDKILNPETNYGQ